MAALLLVSLDRPCCPPCFVLAANQVPEPHSVSGCAAKSNASIEDSAHEFQVICVRERNNCSTYTKNRAWIK